MRGIKKRRDTSNGQQGCSRIIWYKPNEELAAVLYGVTMEEHGISKLVSVKFTTREESTAKSQTVEAFDTLGDFHSVRETATA